MAKRTYRNDEISVSWDSSLCIHSARCIKMGENTFDPSRRPWVDLTLAPVETITVAIEACPTGALRYRRLDGGSEEAAATPATIVPFPNGPLMVRGEVEVKDRHGNLFVAAPRVSLCRCGESNNQPFCDLSHRDSSFRDHATAPASDRDAATSPVDISTEAL